jgi:tRNA U34 5-methylaminomethyl-2-thiouridine-forming methyltransferase MnmC
VQREIIITGDGSHSLFFKDLNETYHSKHGALQESNHVFIEHGLEQWLKSNAHNDVAVLEVGFGTGLNALLTAIASVQLQSRVSYASIEAYPLAKEVWSKLNYGVSVGAVEIFEQLHETSWNLEHTITPTFQLTKYYSSLQDVILLPSAFDVVYFDAFAPSKQPEMWELPILSKIYEAMKPGGLFVTYCAKGQLKRDLTSIGFQVETLPGPPGKKEMVRGLKPMGV